MFFNTASRRSYEETGFTNPEKNGFYDIHQALFEYEVSVIKPSLIVTLGSHPRIWFTNIKNKFSGDYKELLALSKSNDERLLYNSVPVLPFMHLSGLNKAGNFQKAYGIDSNEVISFYTRTIIEKLQER